MRCQAPFADVVSADGMDVERGTVIVVDLMICVLMHVLDHRDAGRQCQRAGHGRSHQAKHSVESTAVTERGQMPNCDAILVA